MKNAAQPSQIHAALKEHYTQAGNLNPLPALGNSSLPQLSKQQQHCLMLKALRLADRTTDYFRSIGVYVPGARIWELRNEGGYSIDMTMVPVISVDGRRRKVALYRFNEPTAAELAEAPGTVPDEECGAYQAWMDAGALSQVIEADRAAHAPTEGGT
ncbi:helix-turn-helix domain-containing protein [Polaromonas sp.]|uniref:helix-turn-helix domain-containing protein n=1 Tax=Polaromonas sp. TaxID=1869339 RepID=UPI00352AEBEF